MITIVNYGIRNLGSILNMFQRVGVKARISSSPEEIMSAEKLVLPGVGAVVTKDVFDYAVVAGVPARVLRFRTVPLAID